MSVFNWTIPESWDRNYFLYVLYIIGYISVFDSDAYGVIPQHCTLGGYNIFYAPKYAIISNPLFRESKTLDIDRDCVLLKLEPDYCGLYDIVDYYGDMMALAAEAAGVNLLNSKLAFVFTAKNKAAAESFKKLYDDIASGQPAAFADKSLMDDDGNLLVQMFSQDVGGNFIADRLLEVLRTIRTMFLTDIGIPNANTTKRERLLVDEVNANNFETKAKCILWLDELKKGCRKIRDKYGINISVELRPDLEVERYGGLGVDPDDVPDKPGTV